MATDLDMGLDGHTPGPWHVRHCSGTIAVRGKRGVCVVHWHGPKDGEQHRRAIADAGLIAAAPELLAALEAVTDDLEAEIEARRGTVLERTTERDLAPVRLARAVIAKTRGDA